MIKKLLITSVISCFALSAIAAANNTKQCQTTLSVSAYWSQHNITFETSQGESLGVYRTGGPLVLTTEHPCQDGMIAVYANPTLGDSSSNATNHYQASMEYPLNKPIAIAFPNDFPSAPDKPINHS